MNHYLDASFGAGMGIQLTFDFMDKIKDYSSTVVNFTVIAHKNRVVMNQYAGKEQIGCYIVEDYKDLEMVKEQAMRLNTVAKEMGIFKNF